MRISKFELHGESWKMKARVQGPRSLSKQDWILMGIKLSTCEDTLNTYRLQALYLRRNITHILHIGFKNYLALNIMILDVAQSLMEAGCSMLKRDDKGQSALHLAAAMGHMDIVKMITKVHTTTGNHSKCQAKLGLSKENKTFLEF